MCSLHVCYALTVSLPRDICALASSHLITRLPLINCRTQCRANRCSGGDHRHIISMVSMVESIVLLMCVISVLVVQFVYIIILPFKVILFFSHLELLCSTYSRRIVLISLLACHIIACVLSFLDTKVPFFLMFVCSKTKLSHTCVAFSLQFVRQTGDTQFVFSPSFSWFWMQRGIYSFDFDI